MKKMILIAMLILAATSSAWAEPCSVSSVIKSCRVEQSDIAVSRAYRSLLVVLGKKFELDRIKTLYQAQDAWQVYRDKSCQYLDSDVIHVDTARDDCLMQFNEDRIKQLTQYASQSLSH